MAIEIEGAVELTLRVRVPIAEGARLTGLLQELAALHGVEIVTTPAIAAAEVAQIAGPAAADEDADQIEAVDAVTPATPVVRPRFCPKCEAAFTSKTHRTQCLGRPPSGIGGVAASSEPRPAAERGMVKPALKNIGGHRVSSTSTCRKCGHGYWTKAHREYCAKGVAVPEVGAAGAAPKRRARGASTNGMKLDHGAAEPDYSEHGEVHGIPRDAYEDEDEWIVRDAANDGSGHTHTFKVPRTSHAESLGRCGCGETRRYRTKVAA